MTCEALQTPPVTRNAEYILLPQNVDQKREQLTLPLEEQIQNVRNGIYLLELRDSLQGIPGLIFPSAEDNLLILEAAEQADILESTINIYTLCDTIVDQMTKDLLLLMREKSLITPSYAIPATSEGADTAIDLITNYHRGLQIKVFIPVAQERMDIHGWTMEEVMGKSRNAIQKITDILPNNVVSVIEQASQASDENLFNMVDMSVQAKASGVCIADSLSFFGEEEAFQCILKIKNYINQRAEEFEQAGKSECAQRYRNLRLEFHGHNDFGLASRAALGALRAGAVVHATPGSPHGIGERAGNASLKDTYQQANDFLIAHGADPVKPVDAVDQLDSLFTQITHAKSEDYGPDGKNADTTCAALHADYIMKIWKKWKIAEEQGNKEEAARLEELFHTGYLPRRGDNAIGYHKFELSPYSNEDTVRWYYHQLTGRDPFSLDQKIVEYILWVIKVKNRPLTPIEISQMFEIDYQPGEMYPWAHVDETHQEYRQAYLIKKKRVPPPEPAGPIKWQRNRV